MCIHCHTHIIAIIIPQISSDRWVSAIHDTTDHKFKIDFSVKCNTFMAETMMPTVELISLNYGCVVVAYIACPNTALNVLDKCTHLFMVHDSIVVIICVCVPGNRTLSTWEIINSDKVFVHVPKFNFHLWNCRLPDQIRTYCCIIYRSAMPDRRSTETWINYEKP